MTTLKQLENERRKQIQNLEPAEAEHYIRSLTSSLYSSYRESNIDKMEYYNNLLLEVSNLLEGIYNNVPGVIAKYDQEYSRAYLVYYDYTQHLLKLMSSIKRTIEFNSIVNRSHTNLLFLMETLYYLVKDLLADGVENLDEVILIKKYNDIIQAHKWTIEEYTYLATPLNEIFLAYDFDNKIIELENVKGDIEANYKILLETDLTEQIDRTIDLLAILKKYLGNVPVNQELEEAKNLINSPNGFLDYSKAIYENLKENNKEDEIISNMSFKYFQDLEPGYNLKKCELIKPVNQE